MRSTIIRCAAVCSGFLLLTMAQPALAAPAPHHRTGVSHTISRTSSRTNGSRRGRILGLASLYRRSTSTRAVRGANQRSSGQVSTSEFAGGGAGACNCVTYVRSQTGLPAAGNAADYTPGVMASFGYSHVSPRAGAILVFDAGAKGASGLGHMAIVTGASHNSATGGWVITVRQSNWGGCGIRSTTFNWGDLSGVNFYVRG